MRWFQGKFSDVYGLNTKRFCRRICLWGLPYPFRKLTLGQISKRFGYTKLLERAADRGMTSLVGMVPLVGLDVSGNGRVPGPLRHSRMSLEYLNIKD